jgi:recombination protein RecA
LKETNMATAETRETKDTKDAKDPVKVVLAAAAAVPPPRERDGARDKAIDLAVSTIEKQFGKGSIMRLGDEIAPPEVKVVPTGSLGLDIALGVGGLPRGRIIEIYGPESSGKTTLALHVVSQAQKIGGICAFVDAEHALDVGYARKLGVRTDDLLVSQPDCGEQALEITEMLVRSGAVDVIVIDSVAALTPRAELEGEMGDAHVGLQARLMSQALRKLTGTIAKSNTLVIFINQIRMKIGVMFGNPETTTGGNALKFYASVRMDIRRVGALKDGDKVVGNRTRVKVVKNKMAPPVPGGGVRHPLRRGDQPRRRPGRPGRGVRRGREVGGLVRVRGRAHRPRTRERQAVSARPRRRVAEDRGQGAGPPRHQARCRRRGRRGHQRHRRRGHRPSAVAPTEACRGQEAIVVPRAAGA